MNLVLLVDDRPQYTSLLSFMLRQKRIATLKSSNADIAMNLINMAKVDLIIINFRILEIDNFALYKTFRSNSVTALTPIIALSSNNQVQTAQEILQEDTNMFISRKNIDSRFVNVVEVLLFPYNKMLGSPV